MLNWPQPIPGESQRDTIERVFSWVGGLFVWQLDIKTWTVPEFWPLESELEEDYARFAGEVREDCDGHASLCRYALWKLGIPNRLLTCDVEPEAEPRRGGNHCVLTPEGTGLVLDSRQPRIISREELDRIGYLWFYMSGLEGGSAWALVKLT